MDSWVPLFCWHWAAGHDGAALGETTFMVTGGVSRFVRGSIQVLLAYAEAGTEAQIQPQIGLLRRTPNSTCKPYFPRA